MALRFVPAFVILLFILPIGAGVAFTLFPAFGFLLPEVANTTYAAGTQLFSWPGLRASLTVTLISGFGATLLSFVLALAITAAFIQTRFFNFILRLQMPFLALPHAALAVGLAFLIAPSGWFARLISPWLTGWNRPIDFLVPHDPWGLSLMLGLTVKELPFLLMMFFTALNQVKHKDLIRMANSLGYKDTTGFWFCVLPQVYPQLRLPLFAVLAYSLSVVDMAMILGPGNPPVLAVQILRWFSDPDISLRPVAAMAAVVQFGLILAAIAFWLIAERLISKLKIFLNMQGNRSRFHLTSRFIAWFGFLACSLMATLAITTLAIWSFARRWRFPDTWPQTWTSATWGRAADLILTPLANAFLFAAASALIALLLALLCLEHEQRRGKRMSKWGLLVLYLPLIIPQIGFLFGVKVLAAAGRIDGMWLTLLWSHLIFVVPYVLLTLSEPFHAVDPRYSQIGLSLGKSPWRVFWSVKLPLAMPAILFATALGFAVSFTQYLPTLLLGAGRYPTLTTEAVALSAGGDRRVLAVYALLQALVPLILFLCALAMGRRLGGRIQA